MSRHNLWVAVVLTVLALALAAPAFGKGKPASVLGNNLSVPVVFAEGYNITGGDVSDVGSGFRSAALIDNFAWFMDAYPLKMVEMTGDVDASGNALLSSWFYPQKTEAEWQADWRDASDDLAPVEVTRLDWGDSLLSKAWTVRSKIRLEIRLYRDNDLSLQGYAMNHLSGTGIDEVWGAADGSGVGATTPSGTPNVVTPDETTVYSNCARLSLYPIDEIGAEDVGEPVFSMPVAEKYGTDGPGGFGAEVNVGGYCIYGYTLDGKAWDLDAGFYRVMFSLDETAAWGSTSVLRNTEIVALDPIDSIRDGGTESEWPFKSELNTAGTASWVDIEILDKGK